MVYGSDSCSGSSSSGGLIEETESAGVTISLPLPFELDPFAEFELEALADFELELLTDLEFFPLDSMRIGFRGG